MLMLNVVVSDIEYLSEIIPVFVPDIDTDKTFTGAVIILKPSLRIKSQEHCEKSINHNGFTNVFTFSSPTNNIIETAKRHAMLDAPLLLKGATGTGKELIAKACHEHSDRRDKPFIVINCAAIPDEVIESELFGYAPNSVSERLEGKKGLIEQAEDGTLFFDEIAEMTPLMQIKLVRLIESNCFRRVGGSDEITVDIRIICSSQKDLNFLIHNKLFREDLYYRLDVLSLQLLPLNQ